MSLTSYFVKRVLWLISTLIGISMLLFFIFAIAPFYCPSTAAQDPFSQQHCSRVKKEWGLDKPLYIRYWEWAWPMFTQLNFGNSWMGDTPVTDAIFPFVGKTIILFGIAFLLSLIASIVVGIIATTNRNSVIGQTILFSSLVGFSIPQFALGIILIVLVLAVSSSHLAVILGIQPILAIFHPYKSQLLADNIDAFIVAEITMLISGTAFSTPLIRAQVIKALSQNYIQTARAKGISERTIIYKHALRSTLLPFFKIIALSFTGILSGETIIEQVFNYSGIGLQLIDAARRYDLPIVLAANMILAALSIFMLLALDIIYRLVDPRVSF